MTTDNRTRKFANFSLSPTKNSRRQLKDTSCLLEERGSSTYVPENSSSRGILANYAEAQRTLPDGLFFQLLSDLDEEQEFRADLHLLSGSGTFYLRQIHLIVLSRTRRSTSTAAVARRTR